MKTFFSKSIGVLIACLVVFLGSCGDTVFETVNAADMENHLHQVGHEVTETPATESADHEHSDGEHCTEGDVSMAHNIRSIQRAVSHAVQTITPEVTRYYAKNIELELEILYDPGSITLNSFQSHIRSVLIRV